MARQHLLPNKKWSPPQSRQRQADYGRSLPHRRRRPSRTSR